ncbi:MAG: ribosome maturation factor RimP [Eubacteriaceae bacterium]|nr:ribosome maturation factor RimP [Eubacteriaceae bacterium]
MIKGSKKEYLYQLLKPQTESLGYDCYDVSYEKVGKDKVLTVYIDSPEGIGLDDCEKVSRHLSAFLDEADPIESNYLLEVSSPGLERRLSRVKHFQDNIGKTIDIRLYRALGGKKKMTVILKDADDEGIIIVDGDDTTTIKYEDISKASLHFEF